MPNDRATAALDAAKNLALQQKFDAALKKHIWFHNYALKIRNRSTMCGFPSRSLIGYPE